MICVHRGTESISWVCAQVAELGARKEMDDIRDWWKVEAKRVKDELYSKICDSVGAPPISCTWPWPKPALTAATAVGT